MVGAETIRVESYGRTINSAEARERREREGLPGDSWPSLVTRRVSLPADVGLLRRRRTRSSSSRRPRTASCPPRPRRPCATCASRTWRAGVRRLRDEYGIRSLVCEGGPNLNATLLPAGLIDELHLVYAPKLAGGHDPLTILGGDDARPGDRPRPAHAPRVRRLPLRPLRRAGPGR